MAPVGQAILPRCNPAVSLKQPQELAVHLLPFGWQRPLFAKRFRVLRLEECLLHAAVDDVPWKEGVSAAVAEDVEIGVDCRVGHRGAPVLAVPLGRFNGGRDAAVTELQQRLIVRVPL